MKFDKKGMLKIMQDTEQMTRESRADELSQLFRDMQAIENTVVRLAERRKEAEEDYHDELSQIERDRMDIQNQCQHWFTTRHEDRSGNGDSLTICDICGYEL